MTIKVRAKPGRIARVSPRGEFIPEDRFVPVDMTPYMRRLIHVHGDVEVEQPKPAEASKPTPAPAKKAESKEEK